MILILSQEENELTTELVMDWVIHSRYDVVRLNGENFLNHSFHWEITKNHNSFPNSTLDIEDINCVWYRRWSKYSKQINMKLEGVTPLSLHNIKSHLKLEFGHFSRHLFKNIKNVKWFDNPALSHLNKLDVLTLATQNELLTPKTLVTNSKPSLELFLKQVKRVITKPISDVTYFDSVDGNIYTMHTKEITIDNIQAFDSIFYPSLFQELIEKKYEIRAFYLNGVFYSMAIFSQRREDAKIDFRNYSFSDPDRMVPFKLPINTEKKLRKLIKSIGLTSCSVDLIQSINNELVFLEINPVGQFGMVSYPCNYYLEKKLATQLIKMSKNEKMD